MNKLKIYKNKTVLVTGHTGFKGGWLSLWLAELGAKVIGYSLKPPTKPNFFEAINLRERLIHIIGDVRDEEKLKSVFKKYKPRFTFHLAAQPLVRLSYKNPKLTYETNVMGTANVLEATKDTNSVKACIVITSDKCYENKERLYAYKETDRLGGYDPYSSSKACAELLVDSYRKSFFNPHERGKTHHMSLSSTRAGNVIGGGDWGEDRFVPDCVRALSRKKAVIVRNPQSIRAWQYILDILYGYLLLGAAMHKDHMKYSGPWNFSAGNESTVKVKELLKLVIKQWGANEYRLDRRKHLHEAEILMLDSSKARRILKWQPAYNLYESVQETIKWYKYFYGGMNKKKLHEITVKSIKNYG